MVESFLPSTKTLHSVFGYLSMFFVFLVPLSRVFPKYHRFIGLAFFWNTFLSSLFIYGIFAIKVLTNQGIYINRYVGSISTGIVVVLLLNGLLVLKEIRPQSLAFKFCSLLNLIYLLSSISLTAVLFANGVFWKAVYTTLVTLSYFVIMLVPLEKLWRESSRLSFTLKERLTLHRLFMMAGVLNYLYISFMGNFGEMILNERKLFDRFFMVYVLFCLFSIFLAFWFRRRLNLEINHQKNGIR